MRARLADRDFIVAYEARSGHHNDEDLQMLAECAQGKKCIFDIGANVGITALVMSSRMSPDGRLFAFDASEACCLVVRENALLNSLGQMIQVVNAVVSDASGNAVLFNWDFVSGNASAKTPALSGRQLPFYKATLTIDDFVTSAQAAPDFIKIDVEGAEIEVLRGMTHVLSRNRPVVWVEVHSWPGIALEDRVAEVQRIADDRNYLALDPKSQTAMSASVLPNLDAPNHFRRTYVLLKPRK